MADSPWTYENGSVNPNLIPSNGARLRAKKRGPPNEDMDGVYNLPPYHPDFQEGGMQQPQYYEEDMDGESDDDEETDAYFDSNRPRVRRGSEGYEVLPIDREEMLRRYMEEMNEASQDKYVRYVPEPDSESEEDSGDDRPLGAALARTLDSPVEV